MSLERARCGWRSHLSLGLSSEEGPGSFHLLQKVAGCTWVIDGPLGQHRRLGLSWLTGLQGWDYGLKDSNLWKVSTWPGFPGSWMKKTRCPVRPCLAVGRKERDGTHLLGQRHESQGPPRWSSRWFRMKPFLNSLPRPHSEMALCWAAPTFSGQWLLPHIPARHVPGSLLALTRLILTTNLWCWCYY